MVERAYGYVVSVLLLGAVLYPLQTDPLRDSFPLSTYPMFSKARPAFITIGHVVGVGKDGRLEPIPPSVVASGEVLQTKVAIRNTIRRGRRAATRLCDEVRGRVAADGSLSWVEWVEVRTDRYQVAGYFSSARKPVWTRKHARCRVERGGPS
jgi:hypothetical protein